MKLHFTNEWLRRKIASDPDDECEAGRPLMRGFGPGYADRPPDDEPFVVPPIVKPSALFTNRSEIMTTSVKVHVNGKYRATVKQLPGGEETVVEGNYNGGSDERTFYLPHPAKATFEISEEQVVDGDERPA